jgi:hypothetical protein
MLLKFTDGMIHIMYLPESVSPRPNIQSNLRSVDEWRPRMQRHVIHITGNVDIPPKDCPPNLWLDLDSLNFLSVVINTIQRFTPLPLQRTIHRGEVGAPARAIRLQNHKETRLSISSSAQPEPAGGIVEPVVMRIEASSGFVLDSLQVLHVFDGGITLEMRRAFFDTFDDGVGVVSGGIIREIKVHCLRVSVGFINLNFFRISRNHS